ncbi:exodeoxyribonuclease V subunit alpha [Paucibacter sp. R3-3]|uniref:RecBCD enzyme subunit RecD n=1 Tax=Roseateles agri TaxID=3098619 RepID=A0ABU5DLV9_9BURK|nr:exodeoxyribonuclease V subunit alpha [Paucibacter sp. R3-3]MDY0746703.1 exodeoxyribonuclease V subunit alpha [Paucibacter sp. R3-3]
MTTTPMLDTLADWAHRGWLRRLDAAFAAFLHDLDPEARPAVLLAAAMLAHVESQGHACLLVDEFVADPAGATSWAPDAAEALRGQVLSVAAEVDELLAALRVSPLVGDGSDDSSPLVLSGTRLYLRRYWRFEQQVAAQVLARVEGGATAVDVPRARQWLDLLFPPQPDREDDFDWQKFACAVALRASFSIITGGPGTGKTYTAARLLALLFAMDRRPDKLRVALAAPTGKAAARLKQSIESALLPLQASIGDRLDLAELVSHIHGAKTLHSLLGARPDTRTFRADAANPLEVDVLIVDEASMVHLEMMAALLQALPRHARLILLGDKDQLASVEAGAVLGDLCRDAEAGRYDDRTADYALAATGQAIPADFIGGAPGLAQQTVMLRESRRFKGPIGQLALAVNAGRLQPAAALLRSGDGPELHVAQPATPARVVRLALEGREGAPGGYATYLREIAARPAFHGDETADREAFDAWVVRVLLAFERFRLLCAVREGEWGTEGLNTAVERALTAAGLLERPGHAAWYEGRPVMVTRNDAGVGVFNGDIGIVLRPLRADGPLRAYFLDGAVPRSVSVSRLAQVETAFAMTVHKSQGSEFEHTVLVLPPEGSRVLSRELVYTGITRARLAFTLASGAPGRFAQALSQRTRRASGLLDLLSE